jgi:hypothetical protein
MKTGVKAKKTGQPHKGGKALRVTIYPRQRVKSLIVEEARSLKMSVSNYVLLTVLKDIARSRRLALDDLLPEEELKALEGGGGRRPKADV